MVIIKIFLATEDLYIIMSQITDDVFPQFVDIN